MTALELAPFLKEYGGWALSALLMVVVVVLDKRNSLLVEKVLGVASSSQTAAEKAADAIKEVGGTSDKIATALQSLSREFEGELRDLRHTVANTHAIYQALYERQNRAEARARE